VADHKTAMKERKRAFRMARKQAKRVLKEWEFALRQMAPQAT